MNNPREEASTDEDILFAFVLAGDWLIVCETSARLYRGAAEIARVELGDAVLEASWMPPSLVLRGVDGVQWRLTVRDGQLVPHDGDATD